MKKNNIKVSIVVCLSILVSIVCFYCMSIEGQCKIELKGYWDPSGQYHEFPPEEELTPEEEFAKRIELIEQQKAQISSTIKDLETLLASRMQYWFD